MSSWVILSCRALLCMGGRSARLLASSTGWQWQLLTSRDHQRCQDTCGKHTLPLNSIFARTYWNTLIFSDTPKCILGGSWEVKLLTGEHHWDNGINSILWFPQLQALSNTPLKTRGVCHQCCSLCSNTLAWRSQLGSLWTTNLNLRRPPASLWVTPPSLGSGNSPKTATHFVVATVSNFHLFTLLPGD